MWVTEVTACIMSQSDHETKLHVTDLFYCIKAEVLQPRQIYDTFSNGKRVSLPALIKF